MIIWIVFFIWGLMVLDGVFEDCVLEVNGRLWGVWFNVVLCGNVKWCLIIVYKI